MKRTTDVKKKKNTKNILKILGECCVSKTGRERERERERERKRKKVHATENKILLFVGGSTFSRPAGQSGKGRKSSA